MSTSINWHGSAAEAASLIKAVVAHCTCLVDKQGRRTSVCDAHLMLINDQRALDGLLFARRIASRLKDEEFERVPVASGAVGVGGR